MTQFLNFKKFTLMEKSKCCNAQAIVIPVKYISDNIEKFICDKCHKECELMEQSESTNIHNIVRNFIETLDDLHNRGLLSVFRAQNKELIEKLNYLITQEKQERDITKSESTASDSTRYGQIHVLKEYKMKELLNQVSTEKISFSKMVESINQIIDEYASQKDAQIQALTKEVDGLKGHIEHLESQIFTLESTEADQISQFKISGNKMAEALNMFIGQNNMSFDSCELLAKKSLELWEKLNK